MQVISWSAVNTTEWKENHELEIDFSAVISPIYYFQAKPEIEGQANDELSFQVKLKLNSLSAAQA